MSAAAAQLPQCLHHAHPTATAGWSPTAPRTQPVPCRHAGPHHEQLHAAPHQPQAAQVQQAAHKALPAAAGVGDERSSHSSIQQQVGGVAPLRAGRSASASSRGGGLLCGCWPGGGCSCCRRGGRPAAWLDINAVALCRCDLLPSRCQQLHWLWDLSCCCIALICCCSGGCCLWCVLRQLLRHHLGWHEGGQHD